MGVEGTEKHPKHKVLGGIFWDIRDPDVRTSRTKTLCKWPFPVVLDKEWPGCPEIGVGASRIRKNFMQENFGLIFRTLMEGGLSLTRQVQLDQNNHPSCEHSFVENARFSHIFRDVKISQWQSCFGGAELE